MTRILITVLVGAALSGILGYLLIPVLRALKAGQSIREIGPSWHNKKAGTPMMGGLMFIFAAVLCLLGNLPAMTDYTVWYVLILSLSFGLIGFLDDFCKAKYKRNLGLTSLQKALLQMAVSALYVYLLYRQGTLTCDIYIPFVGVSFYIHPLLYVFFAMFVMVGCDNAVNITDGIDGLCGSVTIPVMLFFAAAAVAMGKYDLALLPAALDMPLILIPVGLVYIVETLSVIMQVGYFKLTHGKRIFKMAPIHHHFEMCGWKEVKIVLIFSAVSAVMCVLAWIGISGRI